MRYAAAYLLAILGGNPSPDVDAINKILTSVGIECDPILAQRVVDACKGQDVKEIIAAGMTQLDDISLAGGPTVTDITPINDTCTSTTAVEDPENQPSGVDETPPGSPTGSFIGLFD